MADGFSYTGEDEFDVVTTYSAAQQGVQAVATAPGWHVVGGFSPSESLTASFNVTGSVTTGSLSMTIRVFEINGATGGAVGQVAIVNTTNPVSVVSSGKVSFVAGRQYQFQAQVIGGSADSDFGVVNSVQLVV